MTSTSRGANLPPVEAWTSWAARVRDDHSAVTEVRVTKVCDSPTAHRAPRACGSAWQGAHVHVVSMPGSKRARTLMMRRLRRGQPHTAKWIGEHGSLGAYYPLADAEG